MKTWFWLLLAILTLMVGCAPGYSGPAYQEETPAYREMGKGYENPESAGEREERIWSEESGR
jgi:hypothetical protein